VAGSVLRSESSGFTLLEVIVAIAILAIALTSLFGSQSQSLSLAIEARFNVTAAFLVQEKIAEYEAGLREFVDDEGDFGENFPGFTWKTEVRTADLPDLEGIEELEPPLQRLELTINWEGNPFVTTLTYYGREVQQ
jgi:general secretion pathway protein I